MGKTIRKRFHCKMGGREHQTGNVSVCIITKLFFSVHVDDNNIHNLELMWISPDVCQ